jgi:2-oxoglutarate dehydrogenase E2 component (dihydrolipoamide succinyltransferase)
VKEGQAVRENQNLVELESDKVVTELPSPVAGVLVQRLVPEGATVAVGDPLAILEEGSTLTPTTSAGDPPPELPPTTPPELPPTTPPELPPATPADTPALTPALIPTKGTPPGPGNPEKVQPRPLASPLARKVAAQRGVDLNLLRGSALNGRITKQDVLDAAEERDRDLGGETTLGGDETRPHSTTRRRIAERMMESLGSTAQVLTVMEADLGAVLADREVHRGEFEQRGVHLTLTAYFASVVARALRDHPIMNASWTDQGMVYHGAIHLGIAVSLGPEGLLVPVIRNADRLSLFETATAIQDLAQRARERKVGVEELRGGTFTITNHGTSGSLFATPILVKGQGGILGIGALQKRPVVLQVQGQDVIAIRPMAYLSLVFDHRILDGAEADAFLMSVKRALETWTSLRP